MFITLEGIEGCGKTTQIRLLGKRLRKRGIPLIATLEPGGTRIGKKIRRILLDAQNKDLYPLTELILYAADRAQHVEEVIKPALDQGRWVICDRFFDATVVYQGMARGLDRRLIRTLNEEATQGLKPDITFLLDCPVEIGLKRATGRDSVPSQQGQDRFEREDRAFHMAVRKGYLDLARKEKRRFVIVDATLSEQEVGEMIFKRIQPYLKREQIR